MAMLVVLMEWMRFRHLAQREPHGDVLTAKTLGVRLHTKGCKTMFGHSIEEDVRGYGGRERRGHLLREDAHLGYDRRFIIYAGLKYVLFFLYIFVEYTFTDALKFVEAPGPSCGAEGR